MNDITILVNSCDKYEDAWEPFFRLLKIQWPDCPYEIVLNTETKKYNCSFMNVKTICGGKGVSWSKRLKNALKQIDSKYIIYLLEDFFLMSPVNTDSLNKAIELMKSDDYIGYIGLKRNISYNFKNPEHGCEKLPFFSKDEVLTVNRVNSMSALWRREWLISLIRDHETPWEFEIYASKRSRKTPYKVMIINNLVLPYVFDYHIDVEIGYGIYGGKWLKKNKELFDKYGINVNFDNLGFYNPEQNSDNKSNTSKKSAFRERLYQVKRMLRHLKKWIIKKIRAIRSSF